MTNKEELIKYCKDCISGAIPSCKNACVGLPKIPIRFRRVGTPDFPYIWDEKRAEKIVKWFSLLRHSKGALSGTPIYLTAWQSLENARFMAGFTGRLKKGRFRKAFTEVARKNAKSQMEAGEALYEIAITSSQNHEVNEVYTAGVKRDQSKDCI